jgi:hypothetical protein
MKASESEKTISTELKNVLKAMIASLDASSESCTIDDFEIEYRTFSESFGHILQKTDSKRGGDNLLIAYFDVSVILHLTLYDKVIESLLSTGLQVWPTDDENSNLSVVLLIKLIAHDLISLRNFVAIQFDWQFHALSRNYFEKLKILTLCLVDQDFFNNYTGLTNISEEDLYRNYTSHKKLDDRLNSVTRKDLAPELNKLDPLFDLCRLLCSDTITAGFERGHIFVHTNNFLQIAKYYLEDGRINLSPLNNFSLKYSASKALACEMSLLSYISLAFYLHIRFKLNNSGIFHKHAVNIYGQYIKDYYHDS